MRHVLCCLVFCVAGMGFADSPFLWSQEPTPLIPPPVSSPNTPGLRELQEKESLRNILTRLQELNREKVKPKPLLLKIAPDLSYAQLDDVIDLAMEIKLDGLVVSNTSISREGLETPASLLERIGAGGVSGKPLRKISTAFIQYITQKTNHGIPVIGSGGIFSATDASEKINAGAELVQVWTAFIYEGPGLVRKILSSGLKHKAFF